MTISASTSRRKSAKPRPRAQIIDKAAKRGIVVPELLTKKEAADLLRCSTRTVERAGLPRYYVGGVKYNLQDVLEYMESKKHQPAGGANNTPPELNFKNGRAEQ